MDSAPGPPGGSEEENRDSDSPEGGGSSDLQSATELVWSGSGSGSEAGAAEASQEIAPAAAAPEAPEEPGGEGPGAWEEPAQAQAETEEEEQESARRAGDEAEEPARPLSESGAEEAEAGEEGELEEEEEEEEQAEEEVEQELAEAKSQGEVAAAEEEEEELEVKESLEEADEEEAEEGAAAAYLRRRKKSRSRGLSTRDLADLSETVTARKAVPGEEEAEDAEEGEEEEEAADRFTPAPPVQKGPLHGEPPEEEQEQGPEEGEGEAWGSGYEKEQEQQLRLELIQQYNALMAERSRYQRYNFFLQHKISEMLRKKGQDAVAAAEATDKVAEESPEKEQTYLGYVAMLEDLRKQQADDLDWYHQELEQLKQQCRYTLEQADKDWRRFQALKKQVVMQAMGSCRTTGGRQEALQQVEQIQALEDRKEKEMSAVRLENVQLKQCLVHFETRMRAQEDLTQGLHLIDFEQLKIENQTFNEKVEERNEELLKLRRKVSSNVQTVTHVKEKLHFVDRENKSKKVQLQELEEQVALRRDILTKTKQARDSLRLENIKLNQKCGLLGRHSLLQDLEDKVDKTELLVARLESLKRHHASLMLSCRGMKQKIREAKAFVPS